MEDEELKFPMKKLGLNYPKLVIPSVHLDAMRQYNEIMSKNMNILKSFYTLNASWSKVLQSSLVDINRRFEFISNTMVHQGIIQNQEAISLMLKQSLTLPRLDLELNLKIADSVISVQKAIAHSNKALREITIPHMPLYENIFSSIDENGVEQLQNEAEYYANVAPEVHEDFKVVRPYFFDAAVKINLYMTVTNNHIENSNEVTEEEKTVWKKNILPVLAFLFGLFLDWGMGDTPISDMELVKQFEKVVEVIQEYHEPIETTEVIKIENDK